MKETLRNLYNVVDIDLIEIDNGYYFYYLNNKYYLLKWKSSIKKLEEIINITNYIYKNNYKINTFIVNNKGKFYIEVLNDIYVLIKVNDIENEEITLKDIVSFNNKYITNSNHILWDKLWSSKIDKIEEEISTYENDYPIVESIIDYYIGLSENAISYFKDTLIDENVSTLKFNINHKRIPLNPSRGYINNPLNLVVDIEVRDIGEYLKAKVINKEDTLEDIYYIRSLNYSPLMLRILYSRLIYPSYFLDTLEEVITNEKEEKELIKYKEIIPIYIKFLKDFHSIISEKVSIPKIEWLYK